jgi:ubiquinone/menaquinone biosynthesis C-methylase UbiE
MTREDHRALLSGGIAATGGTWADLGSGSGAFTAALAEALGPTAIIYSVDSDERALRVQEREMRARFPQLPLHLVRADFNQNLELSDLDGIVMANSLHFQGDACASLAHAVQWLKVGGRLIIIEYDVQRASPWVPHPVPWSRLPDIAECAGLSDMRLIDVRPSRYHGRVYSAVGVKTA